MKPLLFHPAAAEEYLQATAYYAQINRRLAKRFYYEIERLIQDIKLTPTVLINSNHPRSVIYRMSSLMPLFT